MSKNFNLDEYFEILDKIIKSIILRPEKNKITYDILDTEKTINNKIIALKEKQRQMKIGEIWQEVLGNYHEFINLKIGHETGLDIISHSKKIAIELKNRTNTDNYSSKKFNFEKLAKFKKHNPDYTCIYANINDNDETTTLKGNMKYIIFDDVEIIHFIGYKFINYILSNNTEIIIKFIKNTIDKYS
jgi:hypothetical protein